MNFVSPRRPTLDDVAKVAGVSRSTVSRVVNHDAGVHARAQQKVRLAIAQLGYTPDLSARSLASGRGDAIHVLVVATPDEFEIDPYYGRVLHGVVATAGRSGMRVDLRVIDRAHLVPEIESAGRAIGVLLVNAPPDLVAAASIDRSRVVSLGCSAPGVPHIDPDNVAGARLAVDHLIGHGRTRIATLAGPTGNSCADGRLSGYTARITEAGLRPMVHHTTFREETAHAATLRLLDADPDIDAIFAASDMIAAGALQALAARGRKVPDDVAVVGFDDSIVARCTVPPLTTIAQPVETIAATAARALVEREVHTGWSAILPTSLVVRASA